MAPSNLFLGAPTDIGAPRVRGPQSQRPQERTPNKGPLQTLCSSYRQRAHTVSHSTDKGPSQTRSSYRQGASTAKDPYRRCVIPIDKGLLQKMCCPYRQLGAHTDKRPIQTRDSQQTLCNFKVPLHDIQARDHTDKGLHTVWLCHCIININITSNFL